jgi:hypothetical protein
LVLHCIDESVYRIGLSAGVQPHTAPDRLGADSDKPEFGYFAWFLNAVWVPVSVSAFYCWSIAEPM